MHITRFALAALVGLAGHVGAQCGANQLTTPPNFVSNNGGATGGAVYFSLTALNANGVSISCIDVNTSVGAGSAINAVIYRHLTITDWNLLTSANNTPADWCPLATASGTSAGLGVGSTLTLNRPLDLPMGQHLIAIVASDFNHRYTNGTGANQTISDGNLQFDGGKGGNTPFSASLFSPRVVNATFHYDVPATPVSLTPCGAIASCTDVGSGCGGIPLHVYEDFATAGSFDLQNNDLLFGAMGGSVTAIPMPATPIVPPVSPDLGLGDDQNSALIPLGFTYQGGGICASSISVASNGYIWLGALGRADFSESDTEFANEGARIAAYWTDLNPSAGGTIHVDIGANIATVTYMGVFPFGGAAPEVTCQVEITPSTILVRYDPNGGAYATDVLVGLANPVPESPPPGSVDFSAGPVGPVSGAANLTLSSSDRPVLGAASPMTLTTSGIPAGYVAGTVFSVGACANPGVALPAPFAMGCEQYALNAPITVGLIIGNSCEGSVSLGPVPNNPGLLGLPFCLQSGAVGAGPFVSSNALDCVVGDL